MYRDNAVVKVYYSITEEATGNAPVDSNVYFPGQTFTILAKPETVFYPGHTFSGWKIDYCSFSEFETEKVYQAGDTISIPNDGTGTYSFVALWTPEEGL
jgi:hypothetical protein